MKQLKPYCGLNGSHGIVNGAAPAYPRDDCKHCGFSELTNHNQYCPQCFMCFTCDRIIKRKFVL